MKLIELTKICTKCETRKSWLKFHKHKDGRFGLRAECKICNCDYTRRWQSTCLERIKAYRKKRYKENSEEIKKGIKKWRQDNPDKVKKQKAIYRKNNLAKIQKHNRKKYKKRRKSDLKFKLRENISSAIRQSLKNNKNGYHWENIVGYTLNDLKKHLEHLFTEGMNWDNYGKNGWEIDHKIPISVFNFTKPEHRDFKRCWILKNLQPLWRKDNRTKTNIINKHFQPSLLI